MSTAVLAARKCAKTILWQSLRLSAFQGAIPHVLLVVDRTPCVLQKVLLEGYLQELDSINSASSDREKGPLRVGLDPSACMPSYSDGLDKAWKVTYSALPFSADTFLDDVRALQAFLRQCGGKSADMEDGEKEERWSEEKMKSVFESLAPILSPYIFPDVDTVKNPIDGAEWKEDLLRELRVGPPRELLGCILIERNAFQNELEKYRLRLDLFNMGLRVAEHNHLECMSRKADALTSKESNGNREDCLEDDEVIYYMQSCSLQPHVAELIGRAIADSIDALSWSRRTVGGGSGTGSADQEDENAPADVVVPPASFHEALSNTDIWSVYNTGVLRWEGTSNDIDTKKNDSNGEDVSSKTSSKIIGPGTPLRIICRDGQILTFEGGLEDCLLNTGYYAASHTEERNFVYSHRQRFPVHYDDAAKRKKEMTEVEEDASISGTSVTERRGRLKKKEYLAMLKLQGKKNTTGGTSSCSPSDGGINDNDEDDVRRSNEVAGASVGSSIGGTFPVGEVITESFDLSKLNGSCTVFAYPSLFKEVTMAKPQPVTMRIENGIVTDIGPDAPEDLSELISLVRQVEGSCYVRELGIGLSPHVGRERILSDVTAFERQFGVHVSLGQRHPLFVKQASKRNADGSPAVQVDGPVLKRKAGKYHIDVFLDAVRLEMGSFTLDFTKGDVMLWCTTKLRTAARILVDGECRLSKISDHVGVLALNRPSRKNAIVHTLFSSLQDCIHMCRDPTNRICCLVLESQVDGVFCAGADLKERRSMSVEESGDFVRALRDTFTALEDLPLAMGLSRALQFVLTAEAVDAERALRFGLVNEVVPRGEALRCEKEQYDVVLRSEDRVEGLRAFAEKRQPKYMGK